MVRRGHGGQRAHLVDFGLLSRLRSAMTLTTHGTEYFRDPEMVRMALRGVKVHEVRAPRPEAHFWRDLKTGVRFVLGTPLLVSLAVAMGLWQMCHHAALVVVDVLHRGRNADAAVIARQQACVFQFADVAADRLGGHAKHARQVFYGGVAVLADVVEQSAVAWGHRRMVAGCGKDTLAPRWLPDRFIIVHVMVCSTMQRALTGIKARRVGKSEHEPCF